MSIFQTPSSARLVCTAFLALLLSVALALPASAQQVLVQNGATTQISNSGVWNLQGAVMDFGEVGATAHLNEESRGRVTGGLLTAIRALNSPSSADPAGLGAVLSASSDLGEVTVTRGHPVQTGSGNESIERYYDLSPSGTNSGLSAELIFTYNDAELNSLSESDLELFKSEDGGDTWSKEGVDSRDASANTVTLSGIDSFSRWTLGSEASPLPVELARFEATQTGADGSEEAVRLTWETASETGNAGFEVQRQAEQGNWKQVGYRESKADGGTTAEMRNYRFTDEDLPYAADTLSYRLRQVDVGGAATFSDPVTVARSGPKRLQLKETYPNPAQSRVTVRFAVPEQSDAGDVTIRLYDVLGRQVRTAQAGAKTGRHKIQLSVSDLSSGVYLLRLEAGEVTKTQRLTVVR